MAATDSVGFDREEMYSKSLAGETTAPSIHFFVCTGKATEWSSHLDEDDNPVTALSKQLKNAQDDIRRSGQEDLFAKARITACEVSDGDNVGDVIVFPHMCKVPNVASTAGGAVAFAQSVASSADYLATHGIPLNDTANIFVCAHAARDARCGTCGPVLMSKLKAEAKQLGMTKVNVRGCSHIGGHKYAGNLVVLRKTAEGTPLSDWLGYITPEKCKAVLEVIQTGQTLNIANPGLAAKNWRAQSGLQPSEHAEACAGCDVAGDIEDIVVNSSPLFHVVFILGGPGSGKGTQCEMLVDHFDFLHLSAGDLLRAERNDPNSEHGPLIQEYMKEGKIVPVEITVQLLLRAMKESGRTHILIDGFPRNEDNLAGWERVVGDAAHVHGVLFLDCPEKVMESRLLERGKTSGRTDDNAESIRKRFATYMNDTMPIIEHFGKQDRTWRVVSDRSVHEVFGDVSRVLSSKLNVKQLKPFTSFTSPEPQFKVVFILGGPGSGKGTQCEMLVDHFDFLHLSAGDLLRAERNDPNSEHGPLIQEYIKEGKIVPVEITVQLLLRAMKESGRTHILIDGFPRNEDNLAGWERVVGDAAHVHGVLFLDCPEKVMESRLLERGKTSGRTDDNAESIRKRFATYMNDTMPIIEHFGKQDRTWRVVSDRSVHEVFGEVSRVLSSKLDIKPIKPLPPTTARVSSTAQVIGRRRNIIAAAVASIGVALGCYWYATTKPSSSSSSSSRGARR